MTNFNTHLVGSGVGQLIHVLIPNPEVGGVDVTEPPLVRLPVLVETLRTVESLHQYDPVADAGQWCGQSCQRLIEKGDICILSNEI